MYRLILLLLSAFLVSQAPMAEMQAAPLAPLKLFVKKKRPPKNTPAKKAWFKPAAIKAVPSFTAQLTASSFLAKQQAGNPTAKRVAKVAQNRFQAHIALGPQLHIINRHWSNANQGANTSHFSQSMTIQKLNKLATITINQGSKRPGYNGRDIHQYRFSRPIGTNSNGKPAYNLRVVTDPNQSNGPNKFVVTAFPV